MKKMIYLILGIFLLLCVVLAILSLVSKKTPARGMVDGRLRPCPGAPNCACSEFQDQFFVEPLNFDEPREKAWARVRGILEQMGAKIDVEEEGYLRAVFATRIFRFQDDVELRLDHEKARIHIRSSSRVGYSDFGQNRKRVEKIRTQFMQN